MEIETWKKVYSKLKPLHASGACAQHLLAIDELEKCGLYNEDTIPQLNDVSRYLQGKVRSVVIVAALKCDMLSRQNRILLAAGSWSCQSEGFFGELGSEGVSMHSIYSTPP